MFLESESCVVYDRPPILFHGKMPRVGWAPAAAVLLIGAGSSRAGGGRAGGGAHR